MKRARSMSFVKKPATKKMKLYRKPQTRLYKTEPVPCGQTVTMSYVSSFSTTSAGGSGSVQFRLASIFDPDFTGAGHQPLGHDQWANFYQRYRVLKAEWEVQFINEAAANQAQCCGFVVTETSTGLPFFVLSEYPGSELALISSSEQTVSRKMKGSVNVSKYEGDLGAKYDKDYTAQFGANPVRDLFLNIGSFNCSGSGTVQTVGYIKIIYTVRLYDRIDLNAS